MSEYSKKETSPYRKWILPIAAAAVGVVLLLLGNRSDKKTEPTGTDTPFSAETLSASAFANETEQKIASLCSQVTGAGAIRVAVSLDGGYRAVYASDVQGSDDTYRSETVLTGSGSTEEGILIGYETPRIAGIGIVCTGGDDPTVQENIILLISAAFGVSTNKIYVVGG